MASFRAARAAHHREQQAARSRRIRPELAARLVVTVAGLSAAGLLAIGPFLVQRAAGALLALLVIFGWRWVEQGVARAAVQRFINRVRQHADETDPRC